MSHRPTKIRGNDAPSEPTPTSDTIQKQSEKSIHTTDTTSKPPHPSTSSDSESDATSRRNAGIWPPAAIDSHLRAPTGRTYTSRHPLLLGVTFLFLRAPHNTTQHVVAINHPHAVTDLLTFAAKLLRNLHSVMVHPLPSADDVTVCVYEVMRDESGRHVECFEGEKKVEGVRKVRERYVLTPKDFELYKDLVGVLKGERYLLVHSGRDHRLPTPTLITLPSVPRESAPARSTSTSPARQASQSSKNHSTKPRRPRGFWNDLKPALPWMIFMAIGFLLPVLFPSVVGLPWLRRRFIDDEEWARRQAEYMEVERRVAARAGAAGAARTAGTR